MLVSNGNKNYWREGRKATANGNGSFVDIWFDYLGRKQFISISREDIKKLSVIIGDAKKINISIMIDEPTDINTLAIRQNDEMAWIRRK